MDIAGDRLIELAIDRTDMNSLVENRHLIQADGGRVLMTTDALSRLAGGVVNNTGTVRAQTLAEHEGKIVLLGGTTQVDGTLDASAPTGGNGGFIETSGHTVNTADTARITTLAPQGKTGTWLIDPNDYTIAASGGNITGAALSANLNTSGVVIFTAGQGTPGGNGDIFVNDAVSWANNQLNLQAERNVTINASLNGTGQNVFLVVEAGGRITVSGSGSVRFDSANGQVHYRGSSLSPVGSTTSSSVSIDPPRQFTQIRIETDPTPGAFSLKPSDFSTIKARFLSIGRSSFPDRLANGDPSLSVTVSAPLDASVVLHSVWNLSGC